MRPSRPNRLSALLWAVLFLLNVAGDGLGLHACPHHDAVGGGHHGSAVAGAHAAADHAGHGAYAAAPASDAPDPSHTSCTCLGDCQMGVGVALPPAVAVRFASDAPQALRPLTGRSERLPSRHPPHFLPYGLAPPALG